MNIRTPRVLCLLLITATLLSGCGFKLRNDYSLNEQFKQIQFVSKEPNSPLARAVQQRLKVFDVEVITPNLNNNKVALSDKMSTLVLYPESLDRRLLSLFRSGQVAEYELVYVCRYELIDAAGESRQHEFEILREYQDDPDQVLAKSRELNLILNEMRKEAANRIIRQFSIEQI